MDEPSTTQQADFLQLVPQGWLREYCELMLLAQNEMPTAFHFLSAATIIGNILGLNTWATLSKGVRIYPNINTLLLSPAGSCRRGEGTKIASKVAQMAGVNVLSGKVTPEGLVDELGERGSVFLYVEELSMLLTKQDFQRPIIPVLTKLLLHGDGPCDMRTRQMGERKTVPVVNLSALFTSAPEWFMTTIPEEAFGGGMMSRFLVCCLNKRDTYHIDIQADDEAAVGKLHALAKKLEHVGSVMKGHVKGTDEAQAWIKQWYMANERKVVTDERVAPHRNRKPANALRLAMIIGAAAGEGEIELQHLQEAVAILDWLEPTLWNLYGLADNVITTKAEDRVIHVLSADGGETAHYIIARKCMSYFGQNSRSLRYGLEGMMEKGLIAPIYKGGVAVWPPRGWKLLVTQQEQ